MIGEGENQGENQLARVVLEIEDLHKKLESNVKEREELLSQVEQARRLAEEIMGRADKLVARFGEEAGGEEA